MTSSRSDDFSVLVLASDLGVDHRPFLTSQERQHDDDDGDEDCIYQPSESDYSDLDFLQFFRVERGFDKSGNRIVRIVGKYFPVEILRHGLSRYKKSKEAKRGDTSAAESEMTSSRSDDFSVLVLASDLGVDHRPFLTSPERQHDDDDGDEDCIYQPSESDYSDLDFLQFFRVERGFDKSGNRIVRIVGKYFPAPVVSVDCLKGYVFQKLTSELQEGSFCIVYFHSTVQKGDNCPGITILRWLYEELPSDFKDRLQNVYFVHPGLRSRLLFATLGRFFLSRGLYWKIKYISRLQYLWEDINKGDIDIPEFVKKHDDVLEQRPLTDYGIEPDTHRLVELSSPSISFGRVDDRWSSREFMS